MKATLKDIAQRANVSVSLVSRVIGNYGYVSREKRERVLKAAQELRYKPSVPARSLKTEQTNSIGVIISDITASFFALLVRGADDIARENGYHLIICNSDENPKKEQEHLEELWSRSVDGIILCPTERNIALIKNILRDNIPMVLVDRKLKSVDVPTITIDNVLGAYEGVSHLLDQGYRRIAVIKGIPGISALEDRYKGYRMALLDREITPEDTMLGYGEFSIEQSKKVATELLELDLPPDSFFITSESMIAGTIHAIREKNLRIPEDIGIVTFDDPFWASLLNPPLTTVRQPNYSVGTIAAQKLLNLMRGGGNSERDKNIVLRPELVIRGSCRESLGRSSLKLT